MTHNTYFAPLQGEEFIVLTTFRASGAGVPTTVWFAEADGTLYVTTQREAKKTGRIQNNPRVQVTPSDRVGNTHGETLEARARLLDEHEYEQAVAALRGKYGEQYGAMTGQMDTRFPPNSRIFIAVTPSEGTQSD